MRPEVWGPFQERFNIGHVIEFYGATEGNANLVNNSGVRGAIGLVPSALAFIYPVALVRCDRETGELIRDPVTGFGIKCKSNEAGQLLGKHDALGLSFIFILSYHSSTSNTEQHGTQFFPFVLSSLLQV